MATNKPDMNLGPWAGGTDSGNSNIAPPTDPTLIATYSAGFINEIPAYEVFNYPVAQYSQFVHHLNENGFADWDADTVYPAKAYVRDTIDGEIYQSKVSNSNLQPSANLTEWQVWSSRVGDIETNSIDNNGAGSISFNNNDLTSINSITNGTGNMTLATNAAGANLDINSTGTGANVRLNADNILFNGDVVSTGLFQHNTGVFDLNSSSIDIDSSGTIDIRSTSGDIDLQADGDMELRFGEFSTLDILSTEGNINTTIGGNFDVDANNFRYKGDDILTTSSDVSILEAKERDLTDTFPFDLGYIQINDNVCLAYGSQDVAANTSVAIDIAAVTGAPAGFNWKILNAGMDTAFTVAPFGSNSFSSALVFIRNSDSSLRTIEWMAIGFKETV